MGYSFRLYYPLIAGLINEHSMSVYPTINYIQLFSIFQKEGLRFPLVNRGHFLKLLIVLESVTNNASGDKVSIKVMIPVRCPQQSFAV